MTVLRIRAEPLTMDAFRPFGFVMEAPRDGNRDGQSPVIADPRPTAKVTATLIDLPLKRRRAGYARSNGTRIPDSSSCICPADCSRLSFSRQPAANCRMPLPRAPSWRLPARLSATIREPGMPAWRHWERRHKVASLLSRDGTPSDVDERMLAETIEVDWT